MQVRTILSSLSVITLMVLAAPAMASEGGSEGGLPQLDMSLFPEQIFWLTITFGLLYLLMHFVALPGVKKTQDNRHSTIASELAAAQEANEAAKAMVAQYEKALADARANAQATVSEITTAAAKQAAEKQAKQQQELVKRLHEAEAKIMATRDAALTEVKAAAQDLAQVIVEKVSGTKVKV
ncbi:MAG: F0F1 ATP synthase subunit B' [Alphaproteobacteria bacterium]